MTHELGPLPEPAGFSAGEHDGAPFTLKRRTGKNFAKGAMEPLCEWYSADQMRSYAAAEVARAVAAEREKNAPALAFVRGYLADYASEDGMYDAKHYAKLAHEAIRALT